MSFVTLADYLKAHDEFLLVTHEGPDPDGLGAAYALAQALLGLGKKVRALIGEPLSPKLRFIDQRGLFEQTELDVPGADDDRALASCAAAKAARKKPQPYTLVILDTNDIDYLAAGSAALLAHAERLVFIDHHEPRRQAGEFDLMDHAASSCCELVYYLLEALGATIELDSAEALFAGLVYDTGSFAYPKTGVRSLECARRLLEAGVQPFKLHQKLYQSSSAAGLLLEKALFAGMDLQLDNRVAVMSLSHKDFSASGAVYEDAEDFVNIPLRGKDVEVSILFKENHEGRLRCSLRSKGGVNVAHIAQSFGGGGHKTAAGFTCRAPLALVKTDVLQLISRVINPEVQ